MTFRMRSPLEAAPDHPMLDASQPAAVRVVHGTDAPRGGLPLGPDRWLVVDEHDRQEPIVGATVLDHGYTRISILGDRARDLLSAGIRIDLRPEAFPPGRATPTAYRDIPVVLHARTDRFDVYAPRSLARSIWEWLVDGAGP